MTNIQIHKSIKVKLSPTFQQKKMIESHFNGYRFAYNLCVEYKAHMWQSYRINKSAYDMQKELTEIRRDTSWLLICKAECIARAAIEVENAYKKFYNGSGFPKYKSKKDKQVFYSYQAIKAVGGKISFYGSLINFYTSKKHTSLLELSKIKKITFKKDLAGDYWATCLICFQQNQLPKLNNCIGIDLGIKDLLVDSNGVKYPNKKYLINSHSKLKRLQRKFSRSKKGSKNRDIIRIKIAKLNRKRFNQKEHYYHGISNNLISNNQTIIMENLNIVGMIKNHKLARNISDASWGILANILEYKASWYGRDMIKIDRFFPSTKTCSRCGSIKDMPLGERIYNCHCGLSIDRDINAAINIRNAGIRIPGVLMEGDGYEPYEVRSNSLNPQRLNAYNFDAVPTGETNDTI